MTDQARLLTPAELELMGALWTLGPATVRQVQAALPPGRAYTTVSTLLTILVRKGFADREKEGRSHRYRAAVPREDYEQRSVSHVVSTVFEGRPSALVRRLLDETVDPAELDEIAALLAAHRGDRS